MSRKLVYLLTLVLFFVLAGGIVYRFIRQRQHATFIYQGLQSRKGPLAKAPEWASVQTTATRLLQRARENPDDANAALGLAALFIQEARVTGNYAYYDRAALMQLDKVLELDGSNFQALAYKALIQLSQHHFAEALSTAEQAVRINPYHAFIYGLLVDAQVELGNYQVAVEQAGNMMALRPDLRSYARVAYLREIHGDYPGAIEAMTLAVEAGLPGDEATEWTRVQLGQLYEKVGDLSSAEKQFFTALNQRPYYAYALAGLAQVALARHQSAAAITYLQQAGTLVNDYAFKEVLIDAYRQAGKPQQADALADQVVQEMELSNARAATDETMGHYTDRELAAVYLKVNKVDQALNHALAEYNRRPHNIEVNELLAWVYYLKGDGEKAGRFIGEALRTHCKNPTLLCRAGLIYAGAGNPTKARWLLMEGLKNHPLLEAALEQQSRTVLQRLSSGNNYMQNN